MIYTTKSIFLLFRINTNQYLSIKDDNKMKNETIYIITFIRTHIPIFRLSIRIINIDTTI
ncbi:unknown [Parabacteroides sp. CAG:409]|nr:unknown [Parabacteroides sp. CAG:409]